MRPWVVSSSKGTATGAGTTGITIDRPGGTRPGDRLFAFLYRADDTGAQAFAASGWTSFANVTRTSNDGRASALFHDVVGTEPPSYTFTNDAADTDNMVGIIVCVRGADLTLGDAQRPVDPASQVLTSTGTNDFTPTSGSYTIGIYGHALVLKVHGTSMNSGVTGKTGGAPSGFTLIDYVEEATAAGNEAFLEIAQADFLGAGATGTADWTGTADDATSDWVTIRLGIYEGAPLFHPGSVLPLIAPDPGELQDSLLGSDTATRLLTFTRTATDALLGADTADTGDIGAANPIQYLAVESTLDVPGWTLRGPENLIWKAVDGDAHVPGWFVFVDDPLSEPMTVDIFDANDYITDPLGAVPLATLDLETEGRAWEWMDVKSDTGSGSITLPINDPELSVLDTDDLLIAAFNMYGLRVFSILLEEDDFVDISDDDEIGENLRASGRGTGVLMELGILDPTGGPYRSPVEEDRHWGWPDESFDHSAWVAAEVIGTIDTVVFDAAFRFAGGWTPDLSFWLENIGNLVDQRWPSRTTPVLFAPGTGLLAEAPAGDVYFYEEFTITAPGDYVLRVMMDDRGVTYIDGQQVITIGGINFFGVSEAAVTLSAGTHSIASVVTNQEDTDGSGLGPGKYSWAIVEEDSELELFLTAVGVLFGEPEDVTPPTIIAQCSGTALCLPYPAEVPGQTVTKTIRLALEEIQARGYLTGLTLGCTDTTYTDGFPVLALPDVASKVGQSFLGLVIELAQTYIDWDLDPVTLVLNIWAKDSAGLPVAATFDVGPDQGVAGEAETVTANIVSVRRKRERRKIDRILVKWPGGWAEGLGTPGGGEAPLELGAAQSLDEINRLVASEIARFNNPRTQIDVGLAPEQRADAPYIGFRKFDVVDYAYGGTFEQVAAITVATTENPEDPDITATLRDIVLTPEERQARDLKNLL